MKIKSYSNLPIILAFCLMAVPLFTGCATVRTTTKWATIDKDYGSDKCVRLNLTNIPKLAAKRLENTVTCVDQCCWVYAGTTTEVTLNFNRGYELELEETGASEVYTPEVLTVYLSNIMRTGVINTTAEPPIVDKQGRVHLESSIVLGKPTQVSVPVRKTQAAAATQSPATAARPSAVKAQPAKKQAQPAQKEAVPAEPKAPATPVAVPEHKPERIPVADSAKKTETAHLTAVVKKEAEPRLLKAINKPASIIKTTWKFSVNVEHGYDASCTYVNTRTGKGPFTCGQWVVDEETIYPVDEVSHKVFRQP